MSKALKILMIDKYFFIKGGAERYYFELKDILEKHGHTVIPFSVKNPQNVRSPYSPFFVDAIEFNHLSPGQKIAQSYKIASRVLFSRHAQKKLENLIEKTKPDVAHIHMIDHQISPSILFTLKKFRIPVIQTVHQYKLICPNYRLYNMRTGQICEKCLDGHFYHPILEKCHKDSSLSGVLLFAEATLHRKLHSYERHVDIFHVPSFFMGEKLRQGGYPPAKIRHLFYTISLDAYPSDRPYENYIVYYGRLSEEKGILTLLKAMKLLPNVRLKVVGEGPQQEELEKFVAAKKILNVEFVGKKSGDALKDIVASSKFVVIPSEWYDNSPLVIYEAFSMARPVVGARIGGIPELVEDGVNGFLFKPKDEKELAKKMGILWEKENLVKKFGQKALQKAWQEFEPEKHYEKMMAMYRELLYG